MLIEEYDDLVMATKMFQDVTDKHLMFFSKSGFTDEVKERAKSEKTTLLTIDDLF